MNIIAVGSLLFCLTGLVIFVRLLDDDIPGVDGYPDNSAITLERLARDCADPHFGADIIMGRTLRGVEHLQGTGWVCYWMKPPADGKPPVKYPDVVQVKDGKIIEYGGIGRDTTGMRLVDVLGDGTRTLVGACPGEVFLSVADFLKANPGESKRFSGIVFIQRYFDSPGSSQLSSLWFRNGKVVARNDGAGF